MDADVRVPHPRFSLQLKFADTLSSTALQRQKAVTAFLKKSSYRLSDLHSRTPGAAFLKATSLDISTGECRCTGMEICGRCLSGTTPGSRGSAEGYCPFCDYYANMLSRGAKSGCSGFVSPSNQYVVILPLP